MTSSSSSLPSHYSNYCDYYDDISNIELVRQSDKEHNDRRKSAFKISFDPLIQAIVILSKELESGRIIQKLSIRTCLDKITNAGPIIIEDDDSEDVV